MQITFLQFVALSKSSKRTILVVPCVNHATCSNISFHCVRCGLTVGGARFRMRLNLLLAGLLRLLDQSSNSRLLKSLSACLCLLSGPLSLSHLSCFLSLVATWHLIAGHHDSSGGQCCQMAKFDPFLSLDCARVEGVGAQSKARKGSNFAV